MKVTSLLETSSTFILFLLKIGLKDGWSECTRTEKRMKMPFSCTTDLELTSPTGMTCQNPAAPGLDLGA